MKDFFKYINLEGKAYSELIVRREELKTKYNNECTRIAAKKEKLFNAGDINKMEINTDDKELDKQKILTDRTYALEHICYEETKNLDRLNNQLGYANKMNMRELRKLIKEYIGRFIDNMMTFNQEFYPTINDLLNTWTNIETFVQTSNASVKR